MIASTLIAVIPLITLIPLIAIIVIVIEFYSWFYIITFLLLRPLCAINLQTRINLFLILTLILRHNITALNWSLTVRRIWWCNYLIVIVITRLFFRWWLIELLRLRVHYELGLLAIVIINRIINLFWWCWLILALLDDFYLEEIFWLFTLWWWRLLLLLLFMWLRLLFSLFLPY